MQMELIQILDQSALTVIREFEIARLKSLIDDPMEREMFSWNAPWREESLRHYLATGWTVGIWSSEQKEKFLGYFLGQPLLFYQGLTQVLWVEYIGAEDEASSRILLDTAIKYSREKHLQSVIYNSTTGLQEFKTTRR